MTLDEWYDKWITVCKKHCRTTTKRTYEIQYNRLRESLGWRKLTSINLIVLQDAFNELVRINQEVTVRLCLWIF